MNSQSLRKAISPLLAIVLVALACGAPTLPSTVSSPIGSTSIPSTLTSVPKPQSTQSQALPRIVATPVTGQSVAIAASETDSQGKAGFRDPLIQQQVTLTVTDADTSQPLSNISVSFLSNGPRLLIFAVDPDGRYLPTVTEVDYSKLGLLERHDSLKLAAPARQIGIAEVLLIMKVIDAFQTAKDLWNWWTSQDRPDLERWGFFSQDYCVNSDEMSRSWKAIIGVTDLFVIPGADDLVKGIPALREFQETVYMAALAAMGQSILVDRVKEGIPEGIVRWRVYSINGIPFGVPAVPIGWCLEPLDRTSPDSVLRWLEYGFDERDMFAFDHLAGDEVYFISSGVSQAAIDLEGWIPKSELLRLIEAFLSSGYDCVSYRYNYLGQNGAFYTDNKKSNVLEVFLTRDYYFIFDDEWSQGRGLYLTHYSEIPITQAAYGVTTNGTTPCGHSNETIQSDIMTYRDPDLGFSLQYYQSWHFEALSGTPLIDGALGQTIEIEKDGYTFSMYIQPTCSGCKHEGVISRDKLELFWKYEIDGVEVWRAKVEDGAWRDTWGEGVMPTITGESSVVNIISPTSFYSEPNSYGWIGEYTALLEINGYFLEVAYLLPIPLGELATGRARADILAEMDFILTSITWK